MHFLFLSFFFFKNLPLIILAFWSVNRDWSHVCFCRYSLCWERNKVRSHFFTSSITPLCPGRGGGASAWHPVSLQMHVNALFDSARPAQLFCEVLHLYINIIFYYPLLKLEEWAPSMPWWMQQSMLSCTPTTHSLLQGLASTNTCGGRSTWPQSSLYVVLYFPQQKIQINGISDFCLQLNCFTKTNVWEGWLFFRRSSFWSPFTSANTTSWKSVTIKSPFGSTWSGCMGSYSFSCSPTFGCRPT